MTAVVWPVLRLYVDWNGDGAFGHANAEITSFIDGPGSYTVGRDRANQLIGKSKEGSFEYTLRNDTKIFSKFYASSPIYGKMKPNRQVKLTCQIGAAAETTIFAGRLTKIVPIQGQSSGYRKVKILAQGILGWLTKKGNVNIPMQTSATTGAMMGKVLDSISLAAGFRSLDTGQTTMVRYWTGGDVNIVQALQDLADNEGGYLGESMDGKVVFEDRAHRFNSPHTVSQATYSYEVGASVRYKSCVPIDTEDEIFNEIIAKVRTYNITEEKLLANVIDYDDATGNTGDSIEVPAGDSILVEIPFPTENSQSNELAVHDWTTVTIAANSAANGSGTDVTTDISVVKTEYDNKCELEISNAGASSAYITKLKLYGYAVIAADYAQVTEPDTDSQDDYGVRSLALPAKFLSSYEEAKAFATYYLDLYKDERNAVILEIDGNISSGNLQEIQDRWISDRITVVNNEGLDGDYFVERKKLKFLDQYGRVEMELRCSAVAGDTWAASAVSYTPREVPETTTEPPAVPDRLEVNSIVTGYRIITAVIAKKFNLGIDEAEFRAKFIATTDPIPASVDMRTAAEGGSFAHNGTTQLIVDEISADLYGAQYDFTSSSAGRWYIAWKLHNAAGWSNWSDGNESPSAVTDFAETNIATTQDSGPPSGWGVTIADGPVPNTIVVKATRPSTNGRLIRKVAFQVADGDSVTWRLLDDDAGAADTKFDGSAVSHTVSNGGKRVTRDSGSGFGTAAVGDLVCLDVRGSNYSIQYCQLRVITAFEGDDASTATWFEVDTAFEPQTLLLLNLRIVEPPWLWGSGDGYLGGEANHGYIENLTPGAGSVGGDTTTKEFVSQPIEIPSAVTNPEARVWFTNNYSSSDNAAEHSSEKVDTIGEEPPQSWNNFADSDLWFAINMDAAAVTMSIASSGITFTGARTKGNPLCTDIFAGVISKGLFFPDKDSGILEFECSFDSYVNPTDQTAGNDIFLFGMLGIAGYNDFYYGPIRGPLLAFGRATYISPTVTHRYAFLGNGPLYTNMADGQILWSGTAALITDGAAFTLRMKWGPQTMVAGTIRSHGLQEHEVDGDNGVVNETFTAWGTDTGRPWSGRTVQQGMQIALGCWPSDNSNVASARLTGFTLIEGRLLRRDYGVNVGQVTTQPSYTPQYQIFKVTGR